MRYEMTESQRERFLARIDRNGPDGCWLWTGARTTAGYGETWNGKVIYAHRVAWDYWRGEIPEGLTIDHLCRVRHCVNPDHLEVCSQRTNILRSTGPTAVNADKTHCPRGHLYSGDNLHIAPNGSRVCRACWKVKYAVKGFKSRVRTDVPVAEVKAMAATGMSLRAIGRHFGIDHHQIKRRLEL